MSLFFLSTGLINHLAHEHVILSDCLHVNIVRHLLPQLQNDGDKIKCVDKDVVVTKGLPPQRAETFEVDESRSLLRFNNDPFPCVVNVSAFSGPSCLGIYCRSNKKKCNHCAAASVLNAARPAPAVDDVNADAAPADYNPAQPFTVYPPRLCNLPATTPQDARDREVISQELLPVDGIFIAQAPVRFCLRAQQI
jgi:hypothetical protein